MRLSYLLLLHFDQYSLKHFHINFEKYQELSYHRKYLEKAENILIKIQVCTKIRFY